MNTRRLGTLLSILLLPIATRVPWATPIDSLGTLRGHVWLGKVGTPAPFASLIVTGTRRSAMADADGSFLVTGVPLGAQEVRVLRIGEPPGIFPIEVGPGASGMLDWIVKPRLPPDPVVIGSLAEVAACELEAEIRPGAKHFRVGDAASFNVRIHNHSKRPVLLVESLDASDSWASPVVKVEIKQPSGRRFGRSFVRCGNTNGVAVSNFVEVPGGTSFDPFKSGWIDLDLRDAVFTEPGFYTATFRYATTETKSERWLPGPCIECAMPTQIRNLLARVPAVDIIATTTFEVKPRR